MEREKDKIGLAKRASLMLRNPIDNTWVAFRLKIYLCVRVCVHVLLFVHIICVYMYVCIYLSINIYHVKNQNQRPQKAKDLNTLKD